MVNLVERVLRELRPTQPDISVLDLRAQCRGAKYVEETIKLLPEKPDASLLEQIVRKVIGIGRIHAAPADPTPA
jgi:putative transposase